MKTVRSSSTRIVICTDVPAPHHCGMALAMFRRWSGGPTVASGSTGGSATPDDQLLPEEWATTEPVAWVNRSRLHDELATRNRRYEWCWPAERSGQPAGRALWWGPSTADRPVTLDRLLVAAIEERPGSVGAGPVRAALPSSGPGYGVGIRRRRRGRLENRRGRGASRRVAATSSLDAHTAEMSQQRVPRRDVRPPRGTTVRPATLLRPVSPRSPSPGRQDR